MKQQIFIMLPTGEGKPSACTRQSLEHALAFFNKEEILKWADEAGNESANVKLGETSVATIHKSELSTVREEDALKKSVSAPPRRQEQRRSGGITIISEE